jgi:hypothetical protein
MYAQGKMPTRNRNTRGRLSRLRSATLETSVLARISAVVCMAGHLASVRIRGVFLLRVRVILL